MPEFNADEINEIVLALITAAEGNDFAGCEALVETLTVRQLQDLVAGAMDMMATLIMRLHESYTGSTEGWLESWTEAVRSRG